jgi:hypothetical protein
MSAVTLYLSLADLVLVYTRASASDYDDWKTVYENPGWGSNDLIPLLRKVSALGSNCHFFYTHLHAAVTFAPADRDVSSFWRRRANARHRWPVEGIIGG